MVNGEQKGNSWSLFALSFSALFLELLLIRWAPSVVRLIAYYANLLLISSFLGLGIGLMVSQKKRRLFRFFPSLLLANVGLLLLCRRVTMPGGGAEMRFFGGDATAVNFLVLLLIFVSNTVLFVPLGEQIGTLFSSLPPLRAYAWDLGGALCGTVCFGVFSYQLFSPLIGMTLVVGLILAISPPKARVAAALMLGLTLLAVWSTKEKGARWSPYYYITVEPPTPPPADLRVMKDPPNYVVSVNRDFYQGNATLDRARYSPRFLRRVRFDVTQYGLPYSLVGGRERVVVVGSGGGSDTEMALLKGVRQVDAVEIDPQLIQLSHRLNSSGVYGDPRVRVHNRDARAFLRAADPGYDLVVFGFLDSQALFSSMSNLRLDGFTYTVESFRQAYSLVAPDGLLSVSFGVGDEEWMVGKIAGMLAEATGREPLLYRWQYQVIFCVPKGEVVAPEQLRRFRRIERPAATVDLATDDWPYLYLSRRTMPLDYAAVIGMLSLLSVGTVLALRRRGWGARDWHFGFLGFAFLLLETKSIADCTLYFGASWLVTMVVMTGVLSMALAANTVAQRIKFSKWLYAPLFLALVVLYLVPQEFVLSLSWAGRCLWTIWAVPLPIFFGGLLFSTSLKGSKDGAALFGANLVGAVFGGFSEYLAMVTGLKFLSILVGAAYLASLTLMSRRTQA